MEIAGSAQLADEQVNQKLAEMEAARKSRNFKASDALRAELTAAGVIVENEWERELIEQMRPSNDLWRSMSRRSLSR